MRRECPVARAARETPEAIALYFDDRHWTYAELDLEVDRWAQRLKERGVRLGDRIPLVSRNRLKTVLLLHAAGRLGAALAPINPGLIPSELESLLSRLARSADSPPSTPLGLNGGPVDPVLVALFTSGTTGTPKLVELTHANFFASAAASGANLGAHATQRWLGVLPLFHIGGLAMAHRCAVYGATLVLEPSFDEARVAKLLKEEAATHLSLVSTMLQRLLDHDRGPFPPAIVLVGGGPVRSSLLLRAREAGLRVLQTYGLTEACSQVTTEAPATADGSTAGRPLPGLEVRIVDGEIRVRGPTIAGPKDEWLSTGDLGRLDTQGRLVVEARRTDLIVSGGENISPIEVERALADCPGIADIAVAPRADPTWGQIPVAFVVPNGRVDPSALDRYARSVLAAFKVPRRWIEVPVLPRNSTGKLDRARLRDAAMS